MKIKNVNWTILIIISLDKRKRIVIFSGLVYFCILFSLFCLLFFKFWYRLFVFSFAFFSCCLFVLILCVSFLNKHCKKECVHCRNYKPISRYRRHYGSKVNRSKKRNLNLVYFVVRLSYKRGGGVLCLMIMWYKYDKL
jgi:hypothetical protein